MEIKIYNSLTSKVENFKPIKENEISIYVCGPTVYSTPHIGNFRPPVVFDTFRRFLEYIGYKVTFISNFTDVDDKIIAKAIAQNKSEKEISTYYKDLYLETLDRLNIKRATYYPLVTENMDSMIQYIDNLIKTNHAYVCDGDVYFRVNSVKNYGMLSNIKLEDLRAGARITENEKKENPFDFALWKKTETGITWDSPFGSGRPGWHTECCVLINKYFGQTIDIHGGGFDLKFPHHENEIAQNFATCNKILANYWMHNGFVNFNNEKMSKSLGNVISGMDACERFGGLLTRYVLLTTYYRAPLNISDEVVESAKIELDKIINATNDLAKKIQLKKLDVALGKVKIDNFLSELANDYNISNVMTEVFSHIKLINKNLRNRNVSDEELLDNYASLLKMLEILGLTFDIIKLSKEDIDLVSQYEEARRNKDFSKSDLLRNVLIEKNLL